MSLDGTYTGLTAAVAAWAHRTDLTSVIADCVVLAEARIARDLRIKRTLTLATLSTVANVQTVDLPTDFLELASIDVSGTPGHSLSFMGNEILNQRYPQDGRTGEPYFYAVQGNALLLGPPPDGVYSVNIVYYPRYPALSVTPTNWLLTNHPSIYLYGTLAEVADHISDMEAMSKWEGKYKAAIKQLDEADDQASFGGTALRVRTQ